MKQFAKVNILWDWYDFGIMFRIYKLTTKTASHYFSIDIQILWLNLWLRFWKKNK